MTQTYNQVAFDAHHAQNPKIYELFKEFTFEKIQQGFKHYSHWGIINRVRWETDAAEDNSDFKISNNWIAFYARKFMNDFPQHQGFFKIKQMKNI